MKELIAFIVMAVVIAVLIEFNERRKAKRKKDDCPQEKSESENCSDCSLMEVCDKKEKSTPAP